jgi:hypothetical protein
MAERTLEKNKIEDLTLPDFKAYYKAIVIKVVFKCCNDR